MAEDSFITSDGMDVFQAKYIPKQKSHSSDYTAAMKAYISTYPSMGRITQIGESTTPFTALLEVDESRASDPWEVSIWHSDGSGWKESPMVPLKAALHPFSLGSPSTKGLTRLYFSTPLAIQLPTTFTIKFRQGPAQSWKWLRDHQGTQDGIALLQTVTSQDTFSSTLADYVENLNPELDSKNFRSQSPGTTLWSVETRIDAANGEESMIKDIRFGLPWGKGKFLRWFALVRIWSPWLAPRQGKDHFQLDKEGILCSFVSSEGKHLVLLAISGVDNVMTLFTSDSEGNVVLKVRNDGEDAAVARVLVAVGDDFESANAAVMYHARGVVATAEELSGEASKEMEALKDGVRPEWLENWYDGLTYCTWNALGQQLTEEKVIKAVDTLAEHQINITNLIIDDNWQDIDYRGHGQFQHGWNGFEAEPVTFPNGLRHTVSRIRDKHHSIQHVAVWHAILGYWGGISPDGKIARNYKTVQVVREDAERRNLPLGGKLTVVAAEDVPRFYDDFYRFLSSCGIDSVKTDAQFMLDTIVSAKARRELIPAYLDAWNISTLRHFSVKAISCMSQTPQILFHSQLPQNKPPVMVRNSDDFFPEIPASHPWHIFCNAHNSLFSQHLNIIPDWDMFQTVHDYSGFHAAARCVSGGPIYITDIPGQHNIDLIKQMTGPTTRGKTVIFRPSVIGKSLDQYNGYDDDNLLLIGTYHGPAITGAGMIGVFNISQRPLTELISLSRFPGVVDSQYYVIRAHTSGKVSKPLQVNDPSALVHVSLDIRGYDILSSYPLRGFVDSKRDETYWIANLGLIGKMAASATIVDTTMTMQDTGRISISTNLKALGVLGLYISSLPSLTIDNNFMVIILDKVIPVHTVSISKADPYVLEIDAETAWNELKLGSRWSNELEVKVTLIPKH
ncbi:glycoside hydrolase-2 [Coleophoma cylindrospora]|uniref:Glycoside hydrolase-2 n=1 Tax=Coleophoma cylindrospora TaxID=1849047 RepID=A0A3D8S8D0_9HELO|nr:glycoside hydrolase-2 [Coleophoma cylindrospora]